MSPLLVLLFTFILSWPPLLLVASLSTISHLPGFQGPLPFHLETGYVDVNDKDVLFYYFVKSERNPSKDPLLLWLTGGPGCSSLNGLAFEIGPFTFEIAEYNGTLPTLKPNPYSWTRVSNIIFLDSPVGVGFSFSRRPKGYEVGDNSSSQQAYKFLQKWFVDHPEFLDNPLYIAGDSYAGKVVPIVAQIISQGIEAGHKPLLNLKGYLIGNPSTGEKIDQMAKFPYLHGVGVIPDELYKSAKSNCQGESYYYSSNAECARDIHVLKKFQSEINTAYILDRRCEDTTWPYNRFGDVKSQRSLEEDYKDIAVPIVPPPLWCRFYGYFLLYQWANTGIAREALCIRKGNIGEWKRCVDLGYTMDIPSSINYHLLLNKKGYRALVYSGDHDADIPFIGTQEWIKSMNLSVVDDWRSWSVDDQVAGYTRTYSNNFTFATVKGAGHTAPMYRPKESVALFQRWISLSPL